MIKAKIKLIFLLVIVAIAAGVVWYSPVLFKGYSPLISHNPLLLARNYAQHNVYGIESELNINLPTSLVKEQAQEYRSGNKLTSLVLSQLFKLIGLPKHENLIFISITILALALLIFTITVYYLFNLKTAALFAFIYILLPFNWWLGPYSFGLYEISLFFFALFFLFYFLGQGSKSKAAYALTALSGVFLALAGIAKEAMFLIAPALFVYLLLKKQKKQLLAFFIAFLIIISLFWLPGMVAGKNVYLLFFIGASEEETDSLDFHIYNHLFPDPYTYHFDRQDYLENLKSDIYSSDLEMIARLNMAKTATNLGFQKSTLAQRFKVGIMILARHVFRFFAIEDIGGPLSFLLLILGFAFLRREHKYLFRFFVFWLIFAIFFLTFILLGIHNHLIDFGWAIALCISLGLLFLIKILKARTIIAFGLVLLVLYNLALSDHVLWGRIYDKEEFLASSIYAEEVNKLNILDDEVIAVNISSIPGTQWAKLNYLTNKSMVVFAPETLEKLIRQDKLQEGFDKFGVKYILAYSPELTEQILANSEVRNIVSNDIDLTLPEVSKTKSWLMNLIR